MIILDTNVLSEALRPAPSQHALAWLNAQHPESLYITSISLAEIRFGIGAMPEGNRKNALALAFAKQRRLFHARVLAFDDAAAEHYAELAIRCKAAGLGFPIPDSYIAAIAAANDFIIASRDTAPFQAAGLRVINPWSASESK